MFYLVSLIAFCIQEIKTQSACDDSVTILRNSFGNFLSQAYYPPQVDLLWDRLNSIRASVDTIYLLCYNISPIDWTDKYSPNTANCLISIRNSSQMSTFYQSLPQSRILANLQSISDIIHQTMSDCRDILVTNEYQNLTDNCNKSASNINSLLTQYTDDRLIGNNGTQYLSQITLSLAKQRRECNFRTIINPNYDSFDNCQNSNEYMGYVAEFMENYLDKSDFYDYYRYYRFYFQVAVRANKFCQMNQGIE